MRSVASDDLPHRRRLDELQGPICNPSGRWRLWQDQSMTENKETQSNQILDKFLDLLKRLPWMDILIDVANFGIKFVQGSNKTGLYEVLTHESILEFHDAKGQRATYYKRQKVRYLQDNIIAYQDQAWGDGEILQRYRCSPGKPVDRYRLGHKTHILISLREVKNKGDEDEFNIQRGIRNGFLRNEEQWETEISHPTDQLKIRLLFPKDRYPRRVVVLESDHQRSQVLPSSAIRTLPDGRCQVTWEQANPRLHERYILKWVW
jgi:hypothetical protein